MKKIAHLMGALVLAAGGTLGLALPAAAAPSMSAPATAAPGDLIVVNGTECVGDQAFVTFSAGADSEPIVIQPEAETGSWSIELEVGSESTVLNASCSSYESTFDYAPATVDVFTDAIGTPVLDGCVVTIPVTVAYAGEYVLEVADDGESIASLSFTTDAAASTAVTWTIEEPAMPGAIGVGLYLYEAGQAGELAFLDPFEYSDEVALSCAQENVTLAFPGYTGSVVAGGTLQIDAAGFLPGEEVVITMYSTPVVLATLLADTQGRVVTTVTIPADTAAGSHTIEVAGRTSGLSVRLPIQVLAAGGGTTTTTTAPPRTTTTRSGPVLAATGTTASAMIPWAAGLVLLGGAALVLTRRRSTSRHQ